MKYNRILSPLALLCGLLSLAQFSFAQTLQPPAHVWVSLSSSPLQPQPPDATWVRVQQKSGTLFRTLRPLSATIGKLAGIIVPVFDDGRTFYATQVEPFKNRNPQAAADEQALRHLLAEAKRQNVPIYLAVDALAWQKTDLKTDPPTSGLFAQHPQWRETRQQGVQPQTPSAFYASLWHEKVRYSLRALMSEIGTKFPEAAGVVVNLQLSDREIIGFSDAARSASIGALGLDPFDLNLQNRIDDENNIEVQRWRAWKCEQLANFGRELRDSYLRALPNGRVLAWGMADYYARQEFNDLRASQDWRGWLQAKVVDGVLLEGRWTPRYPDAGALAAFKDDPPTQNALVLPVIDGAALIKDSDFARDWSALKNRADKVDVAVFAARSSADLQKIIKLSTGEMKIEPPALPQKNEPFPDLALVTPDGKLWQTRDVRGHSALAVLLNPDATSGTIAVLEQRARALKAQSVQPVMVARNGAGHTGMKSASGVLHLLYPRSEVLSRYPPQTSLLLLDQAGFLRSSFTIANPNQLRAALEKLPAPTPKLQAGQTAPNFSLMDMNGQLRCLSDLRGRKNLLLTFFPKSFTGSCANHLKSLRDEAAKLQAFDTEIWAVSIDAPDVQIAFAKSLNLPFPLIPDVGRNLALLFQAADDVESLAKRMSVLIDKNGIVRVVDTHIHVHSHGADMLAQIRALGLAFPH